MVGKPRESRHSYAVTEDIALDFMFAPLKRFLITASRGRITLSGLWLQAADSTLQRPKKYMGLGDFGGCASEPVDTPIPTSSRFVRLPSLA